MTCGLGNSHHIFYSNAELACQVDSWLDRHNHALAKPGCLFGANSRRFMNLQADTMAGGVGKCLRVTLPAQNTPRSLVYIPAFDPGDNSSHRSLLRFKHCLVCVPLVGPGPSQVDGSGHIRAVTFEDNTEVEGQKASFWQFGLRSASVGKGGALA